MSDSIAEKARKTDEKLKARPYQTELLKKAIERNIIVCLGTGTGKTFISVLLIKELSHQIITGEKKTFFLVNTVPLVMQQKKVIEQNTSLRIGGYVGEMGVDFWNDEKWKKELDSNDVIVMTAQIFVDLLGHARIRLSQVNLIVFDECHHAKKEHPYTQVMKYFESIKRHEKDPRILGLTASIVNGKVKPYKIESEITNLERILRAACETSFNEDVEKFATKPDEIQLSYSNDSNNKLEDMLLQEVLEPWDEFVCDYRRNSEVLKLVKSIVKECMDTIYSLGPSACNDIAERFLKCVLPKEGRQGKMDPEDKLIIEYASTQLRQIQRIYRDNDPMEMDEEEDAEHISNKLSLLVDILKQYGQNPEISLCGIVFVQRRITAALLSDSLNTLSKKDSQLNFLKCSFVVGHGTVGTSAGDSTHDMSWKKQEAILRKFRSNEINLLIATSVVEEGIDVPKCNLVVRFDFPKTFQSYVQSKGRARAKPSKYIILTSNSDEEGSLDTYHAIEEYLSRHCHDRPLPEEEESSDAVLTDLLPPYRTCKDATLRTSNSISMLNRYCSKLPRDSFTPLNSDFDTVAVGDEAYQCTVKLPINCPIKEKITGDVMPSKQQAKSAAAYEACKQLHQKKELNDYLLPMENLSSDEENDEEMETDEETGAGKPKRGTKRSRKSYSRKVPEVFKDSLPTPGRNYFLYTFTKKQRNEPNGTILKFGMILNTRIPEIRPFVIYPDDGREVLISVCECTPNKPTKLSRSHISTIDEFNRKFFSELLRIPCEMSAKKDGYYIVPLTVDPVDIDLQELKSGDRFVSDPIDASDLEIDESIITPHHRSRERFVVDDICTHLSPKSSFPDLSKAKTYQEYFQTVHQLKTKFVNQPLVSVKRFPERINFLVNRKKTKREVKDAKKEIHFIPEHCSLHPFPASLLHAAAELPSILYRIKSILLVAEVRELIAEQPLSSRQAKQEKKLSPIGKLEKEKSVSRGKLQKWFSQDSQKELESVDSYLVLQALTTKGSGDAFDLERLEMLGDAFLKQAVSICLYCCYQNKHEGKLTKRKVREISNLNLFRAANRKELPTFMQNTVLDRKSWLPLCLDHATQASGTSADNGKAAKKRKLDEEGEECKPSVQCISDKAVADSIEALIGAYLVSCGYQGALKFLKFLGIKVFPDDLTDPSAGSSKYANFENQRIVPLTTDKQEHSIMALKLKQFEEKLNYKFNDKMFLVQALTHASYENNILAPDCYQRLEFLGDAVLDFLVTECLYSSNPGLSPGELTDLRQALVNNNIFAKIAVEYDYQKYLQYTSPEWFSKINKFVVQLEDDREEGKPQVDKDPFVIMSNDEDGAVEAPKVLGDIFESVAGAIFLDSGMDVVQTWKVYHQMMKPYIDYYSENVPYNPIRLVHENDTDAKFSEAQVKEDGKICCQLTVKWGKFTGKGTNKKFAKLHAARLAMDAHASKGQV